MDLPPPPPRVPGGGRGARGGLRKQALMGAARSGGASALLEEGEGGDQGAEQRKELEQASTSGRAAELRPWTDYWDGMSVVEVPERCGGRPGRRQAVSMRDL